MSDRRHPFKINEDTVRENLRRYRKAAERNQADIAEDAHITQGQLSHLEVGRRKLKVNQLLAAAEAIGISAVELFETTSYNERDLKLILKFHRLLRNKDQVPGWEIIANIIMSTEVP